MEATAIIGSQDGDLRIVAEGSATLHAGLGLAAGKGFEFGFFLDDVSDFKNSTAISIDTPLGSATIYGDESKGNFLKGFQGIGIGGPSLGAAITITKPELVKDYSIIDAQIGNDRAIDRSDFTKTLKRLRKKLLRKNCK